MSQFVHHELHSLDPDVAKEFYAELFGWTYQDMPMPEGVYTMISGPDGGIGGISPTSAGGPAGWLGYVAVASVDDTSAKVLANGGQIEMPKQEVPGMGWMAWYTDPHGNRFAVWEPMMPAAPPKKAAKKATKKAAKKATKKAAKKATKKTAKKTAKKAAAKPAAKKKAAKKKSGKPARPK